MSLGGDLLYSHKDPAKVDLGKVRLECVGEWQWLEVGGTDFDLQWQLHPNDNFGYRQLIIGESDHATVVQLVDLVDNNLQEDLPDSLILWGVEDDDGVGGQEGIQILGGSTLVIHELNVYALLDLDEDGVMERKRLQDLFDVGETRVRFDHNGNDGWIIRPDITPPIGAIDARKPSDQDGSNPVGWTALELVYLGDPAQLHSADFLVEVSGGVACDVVDAQTAGTDTAIVALDCAIPVGQQTKVTHLPTGTKTCVGYLPGDVDGGRASTATDVLTLIDCLNGVVTCDIWQGDVDRSGVMTPTDILMVIDLLNGAGEFDSWNNVGLPECP